MPRREKIRVLITGVMQTIDTFQITTFSFILPVEVCLVASDLDKSRAISVVIVETGLLPDTGPLLMPSAENCNCEMWSELEL